MAQELCDRVAIINEGRLIADRTVGELLSLFRKDYYTIRVGGQFNGEESLPDGLVLDQSDSETTISGDIADQDRLHQVLRHIREEGLPILSVQRSEPSLEHIFMELLNEDRQVIAAPLVLYNEVRKGLIITWNYRANSVMELLTLVFVFVFISYFAGGGEIDSEMLPGSLLGFLVWYYAAFAISGMSGSLTDEASTGTLEQLYMSPVPTWLVFVGKVIATFMSGTALVAIVGVDSMDDPSGHSASGIGGPATVRPNDDWPFRLRVCHWRPNFDI